MKGGVPMSRNKNAKSPTAALRERVTATYSEMRGTPEDSDAPSNPWDLMTKNTAPSPRPYRLPRFNWTYVAALAAISAVIVGIVLLLK